MITRDTLEKMGFKPITSLSILPAMLKGNTQISFMGSKLRILVHSYREIVVLEIENNATCLSRINGFLSFANSDAGAIKL